MAALSQALLVAGGLIFLLLGGLHGWLTLRDLGSPRAFTPPDPALRAAMQASSIRLNRTINLWDAWMGFNLTHSLGLVLFGGAFLWIALGAPALFARSPALQACGVLVSALYLAISARFFFRKPVVGSALALACFTLAAALAWA